MQRNAPKTAESGSDQDQPDKFKTGDTVKHASGTTGEVLARVPFRDGDSHRETYVVNGLSGTIPAEALTKAE